MKLIYSLSILFFIFSPLYGEIYGSVSGQVTDQESEKELLVQKSASIYGQVTDEKSGAGIPGVKIRLGNRKSHTDNNGIFTFKDIEPDNIYDITFYAPPSYCPKSVIREYIFEGEHIVNLTLGHLGSLMGKIYKSKSIPFRNVEVRIKRRGFRKSCYTKEDGSFFVEGMNKRGLFLAFPALVLFGCRFQCIKTGVESRKPCVEIRFEYEKIMLSG